MADTTKSLDDLIRGNQKFKDIAKEKLDSY